MTTSTNISEQNPTIGNTYKLLFASKEAAQLIDVSDETLRRSRCTGYLLGAIAPKHIKFGRTVKYRLTELTDWVNAIDENGMEGL